MTHVLMGFSGYIWDLMEIIEGNDGSSSHVWWHSLPSIAGSTDDPCLQTLIQCRGSGPARATSGEQESPKWASKWLDFERKKRIPQKTWNFHQQNILEFYYSTIDVDPFRVFFFGCNLGPLLNHSWWSSPPHGEPLCCPAGMPEIGAPRPKDPLLGCWSEPSSLSYVKNPGNSG